MPVAGLGPTATIGFRANGFSRLRDKSKKSEVAEHLPRPQYHRGQRIVGDGYRQAGLLADALVEVFQQRSTARQHYPAVADISGKLGRGAGYNYAPPPTLGRINNEFSLLVAHAEYAGGGILEAGRA